MEAAVVDPGSSLLKAGFAIPDQTPAMVRSEFSPENPFSILLLISFLNKHYRICVNFVSSANVCPLIVALLVQIIPTQMKRMLDDGSVTDNPTVDDVAVDPVYRGYVRDWDAMEDLLHYVLYTGLGWEIGNEGQILFTDPLCTPKVSL